LLPVSTEIEIPNEFVVERDRSFMKGDRVAILGRGIAVVEHADDTEVQALLRNRIIVRMRRKDIAWDRQNMRWEAKDLAP
jgi:hypothetical protein